MDYEKQSTHSFNMSLSTLERIDTLIKQQTENRILANGLLCERILKQLFKELYPFLTDDEKKKGRESINTIRENLKNSSSISTCNFYYMDEFEYWIRDKLHEKGLLMAKADEPGIAIGG